MNRRLLRSLAARIKDLGIKDLANIIGCTVTRIIIHSFDNFEIVILVILMQRHRGNNCTILIISTFIPHRQIAASTILFTILIMMIVIDKLPIVVTSNILQANPRSTGISHTMLISTNTILNRFYNFHKFELTRECCQLTIWYPATSLFCSCLIHFFKGYYKTWRTEEFVPF